MQRWFHVLCCLCVQCVATGDAQCLWKDTRNEHVVVASGAFPLVHIAVDTRSLWCVSLSGTTDARGVGRRTASTTSACIFAVSFGQGRLLRPASGRRLFCSCDHPSFPHARDVVPQRICTVVRAEFGSASSRSCQRVVGLFVTVLPVQRRGDEARLAIALELWPFELVHGYFLAEHASSVMMQLHGKTVSAIAMVCVCGFLRVHPERTLFVCLVHLVFGRGKSDIESDALFLTFVRCSPSRIAHQILSAAL